MSVFKTESVLEWLRGLFAMEPGSNDWWSGLRLTVAFLLPVAVGLSLGQVLGGLFVGIGAFFAANADLGYDQNRALQGMCSSVLVVPAFAALGMSVGDLTRSPCRWRA